VFTFDQIALPGPRRSLRRLRGGIGLVDGGEGIFGDAHLVEGPVHDLFQVQSVEVQYGRVGEDGRAQFRAERHTELLDGIGIVFDGLQVGAQCIRDTRFAEFGHLDKSIVIVDTHDTRDDGTVDTNGTTVLYELVENSRIEEHLGNDKVWRSKEEEGG